MTDIKCFTPDVDSEGIPFMRQIPGGPYVEYIEYLKVYNQSLKSGESTEVKDLKAKIRGLKCALRDATDELDEINGH